MAATYTEDAELTLVAKDKGTGEYKPQDTRGRAAVQRFYQDLFKDQKPGTRSRNMVEFAHFVGGDLLIIHGTFTPDVDQGGAFPFVQVRAKAGERWLIMSLQVFVVSESTQK
jgi:hypothetical protein